MKKKIASLLALLSFCALSFESYAQNEINTEFINRMNYVFGPLEKNRVPNGLLLDHAMEFTDLKNYNGVLTDTNKVSAGSLRDIYSTVFMSAIHANAGGFYSPDYVDSIWALQRQPGIITLSGVYYNYSRFRDDAVSANRITVSNERIYDRYVSGVWQNPYQTETVFAMSPPLQAYSGRNLQVVLPSNLWFTNNAGAVSSVAVNFNDGAGYRTLTMGQTVNINYADTGSKTWTFRLTLTNNTTLYSHTEMKIDPEPNGSYACPSCRFPTNGPVEIPLTADDAYLGEYAQGWIHVDYANSDLKLRKPLIVVEGFDPGYLLTPELEFGQTDFGTFSRQISNSNSSLIGLLQGSIQQYDIIYVNWKKGADYLQRNGYFLERVMRWVREQKIIDGCTEPNVVLGQSMGGVIGRWALRDMENRSLAHQTRLFISWDSPHQGANVPVAYQHAARHANNLFMSTAIPILFGGNGIVRLVKNALNLADFPAAKQMLYYRVQDNGQLDNSLHNTWQTELRNMGYPAQCRNVAVSNGSECAAGQGFNAGDILLRINGKANTRFLGDLIGMIVMAPLAGITNKPALFLGILPGKNSFTFDVQCNAQPEGFTAQIYKGKITYTKKVLWLINANTTLTNRTRNSDPSVLPIDATPGGMYDTEFNPQSSSFQNWAVKYNLSVSNIPHFNFIPTVSALDIGGGNTTLAISDFKTAYVGGNPPAAPKNTPFANFTTAFNTVFVTNGQPNNNENHIQIATRNGNFVAEELNGNTSFRTNCLAFCQNGVISGNDVLCSGSSIYTAPSASGVTYNWSVSDPSLVTTSQNSNSFTITANPGASGLLTITAQITGTCGSITLNKYLTVGAPTTSCDLIGAGSCLEQVYLCASELNNWQYVNIPGPWGENATGYHIEAQDGNYFSGGATEMDITSFWFSVYSPSQGPYSTTTVTVRAMNSCGVSPDPYIIAFIEKDPYECGYYYYSISPNPAKSTATISLNSKNTDAKHSSFDQVIVYDQQGNLKMMKKFGKVKTASLNISNLMNGIYFVEISNGTYKERQQLLIQK
jgi:hypothetical protein